MLKSDQECASPADHATVGQPPVPDAHSLRQLDAVRQGAMLKDFYGIPDSVMDTVYACAYNKYQNGLLDEAMVLFRFLLTQNILNPEYALGLAAVFQRSKQFQQAVDLYALAFGLGQQPQAMFYAGQCYLNLHNPAQARACFLEATKNGADAKLLTQAKAYLSALDAQQLPQQAQGDSHG